MKKFRLSLLTAALGLGIGGNVFAAEATNLSDWFSNGDVSGDARLYDFGRDYAGAQPAFLRDMNAVSLGGKVKFETATWDGFSAAAALYGAYDIGMNNYTPGKDPTGYNLPYLNPLLMGTNRSQTSLGEAYLQYQNPGFMLRAGNELIDNPWINPSDGFMIPNLFEGVSTKMSLGSSGAQLSIDRVFEYKNRSDAAFDETSLSVLPYQKVFYPGQTGGATDAGLTYKGQTVSAAAWLYQWDNLAQMTYLEGGYTPAFAGRTWFVNGQYVNEIGLGSEEVGPINAQVYGLKLGMNLEQHLGNIFVAYNDVPSNGVTPTPGINPTTGSRINNTVYNGNLYSPYTQVYNTDPLYTTVMNYGLVNARAPGSAWMLGANLHPMNQLDVIPTISEYYTDQTPAVVVPNVRAYMLDVVWHFSGKLKGLSLRDRLGVEHDVPLMGSAYVDNRIMMQYNF
ncbi:MAG: hypothetical protein M0Z83_08365 [Betaproteobacteria bacterium]|nr:hypothetical protein [Betaproteobacteria bacterium]